MTATRLRRLPGLICGGGGGFMREGLHVGLPERARCNRMGQGCLTLESQAVATLWGLEPLRWGEL